MKQKPICPHCDGDLDECAQWSDAYLSWVCVNTDELLGSDDDIGAVPADDSTYE